MADPLIDALRKGHPIMGPDDVDTAAADKIEQLTLALTLACLELEAAGHPMAAETYRAALAKAEGQ